MLATTSSSPATTNAAATVLKHLTHILTTTLSPVSTTTLSQLLPTTIFSPHSAAISVTGTSTTRTGSHPRRSSQILRLPTPIHTGHHPHNLTFSSLHYKASNTEHYNKSPIQAIREIPLTWDEMRHLLESEQLHLFGRNPANAEAYAKHKQHIVSKYHSLTDYIKHTYLPNCYEAHMVDGRVQCSDEPNADVVHQSDNLNLEELQDFTCMAPNAFPYALDDTIHHDVLWSARPLTDEEIGTLVELHRPSNIYQTISFVNPPILQSIRSVYHVQIFSRELDQATSP